MSTSEAVTRGVRVQVQSQFVAERSDPDHNRWFFVYQVRIANEGPETVQLVSRHWVITDERGRVEEVKGPGVVGEQPSLKTGESFEYISACPLSTSFGVMQGTYQMVTDGGARFDAEIAPFTLGKSVTVN